MGSNLSAFGRLVIVLLCQLCFLVRLQSPAAHEVCMRQLVFSLIVLLGDLFGFLKPFRIFGFDGVQSPETRTFTCCMYNKYVHNCKEVSPD